MYLVSVYFDDKSNKIISDYINKIALKDRKYFYDGQSRSTSSDNYVCRGKRGKNLTEVMEQLEGP